MFTIKISFDFVPHLALTSGSFPDRQAAEEKMLLLARYWLANGWRQGARPAGSASQDMDGRSVRLQNISCRHTMVICAVPLETHSAAENIIDQVRDIDRHVFENG